MDKKIITKGDIILAIILLIIGIGSPFLITQKTTENAQVVITIDGEKAGAFDLNTDDTIYVITKDDFPAGGIDAKYLVLTQADIDQMGFNWDNYVSNKVLIENGKVRVVEATCAGHDCINTGAISKEGQIIACLPHRLMVTISNPDQSGDVDVVIK